mmetsp:Transcript_88846/g.176669  ORF Transcript_88846/g.176669 Transcript_88846/m.176669 type:complete len:169 (-) Transcript_88846:145-651(-)|eukprot:CAMPEP_0172668576 /NCGR_PEP_ID=MMETSP1074-20121228/9150_1 /TAXON_ID=2916 /ORGANISM="Ceratium fusus, Strain PA161109" /LENGTH=168 /DNA_ID=CAMNT_0013485239 /DNA_START=56 /DNA_END=562 /DNA_ORIENTATION=-
MATWKDRPRRFVEPPLVTSNECLVQKQTINKEMAHHHKERDRLVPGLGGEEVYTRKNDFLQLYKVPGQTPHHKEHQFTVDRVMSGTEFDQKTKRDTCRAMYTEAYRKRCTVPFNSARMIRTSQAYGRLPPIDMPNLGLGRSPVIHESSMDRSHLGCNWGDGSKPWTVR